MLGRRSRVFWNCQRGYFCSRNTQPWFPTCTGSILFWPLPTSSIWLYAALIRRIMTLSTTPPARMRGREDRERSLQVYGLPAIQYFGGYVSDDDVFAAGLGTMKSGPPICLRGHSIANQPPCRVFLQERGSSRSVVLVVLYFAIRDYSNDFSAPTEPLAGRLSGALLHQDRTTEPDCSTD